MRRQRHAKIVATLGPASSDSGSIRALFEAGADVFRLNFSHGTHEDHRRRHETIRVLERETGRPVGILADLQGPKLRVASFAGGQVDLPQGAAFGLDLDTATPGDARRVGMPHPEVFEALSPGVELLLDDGKLRLRVETCGPGWAETRVVTGGMLSNRKGVSVIGAVLPLSALTEKDRDDLRYALDLGVDWIALSFVQRPEDLDELRGLVQGRAGIMAKLEKPSAIERLEEIVAASDAVMLSAESASGRYPVEAVAMMDRIIAEVERDPFYRQMTDAAHPEPGPSVSDAICCGLRRATNLLPVAATITYTSSGSTTLRAARERPAAPILGMATRPETARRLALVWGVHSVLAHEVGDVGEMSEYACETARREGFARAGDIVVIAAGMPFGVAGTTNLLKIMAA